MLSTDSVVCFKRQQQQSYETKDKVYEGSISKQGMK